MTTVEVFDPAMCCATGVCGPSVDPALATFAADLTWLAAQAVRVERHSLSQEPKAFAETDLVRELLDERGEEALPAVVVDGELRCSARYPTRAELAAWSLGAGAVAVEENASAGALTAETTSSSCCGGPASATEVLLVPTAPGTLSCCG